MKKYLIGAASLAVAAVMGMSVPADATHGGSHCKVIAHRGHFQGTENQVAGVANANKWGHAEIDASVTKDGQIIAVHDARLGRLTGGASNAYINELTYKQIQALPYLFGDRIERTRALIREAARTNDRIMVTVNNIKRIKDAGRWDETVDKLVEMTKLHPNPKKVYIGGFGIKNTFRSKTSTFFRYSKNYTAEEIFDHASYHGHDLVGLSKYTILEDEYGGQLFHDLRDSGILMATRMIRGPEEAREVQVAFDSYNYFIQGNYPRMIATKWCQ